ncbi:DUF1056 domain-containing protein [Limosilactobacillus reuteri]|uniref:DUF1056 domain-containing protein n=1 Tax=Limosilactobacillus reuteri TaxID=1598 RepID=A0ABD6Y5E9_LIMRT|nr:DUF1056 domain-containing protein [Limosilactobacillus reuteri]PWT37108.1 DUF1056 domain-containing protein [Limosilactobacillus reuteri]PWT40943.1 DUF1056 domain-containing protein [Limosilactobacillus reuteri]
MIKNLLTVIWKYFDVICFLSAMCFAIWGCFLLSFIAGIFSVAISLIILGYLSEKIANLH